MELHLQAETYWTFVAVIVRSRLTAAAGLFQDHPHITIFPGDGIDVMPVVTAPPED